LPQIGRFLSTDPYIQSPYNTQSYNRYSYTINNPLEYTHPDGNFFLAFLAAPIAIFVTMVLVIAAARKAKKKFPSGWVYSSGLFIV
jgi:hypothetical protein